MKNSRRLFVLLLAFAVILNTMTFLAVPSLADGETTAYLSFADTEWAAQYWFDGKDYSPVVANNKVVTGYGQYTVSLDFTGVTAGFAKGIAFMDVEISGGETAYPNSFMTIDSLKINGEAVTLGKTYTSSDDGIATRTNLYNEWVPEVTEGRTVDGDNTDVTPIAFDKAAYTEIKTIEVTFTLGAGVPFGDAVGKSIPLPAEGTTAYITMADSSWTYQYWFDGKDYAPVVANNTTVTGYGQYTVSLDFTGVTGGVCPDIAFMDVEVKDGELYFPYCYMQIDSVKINGEAIEYGKTYTSSDNKKDTRTNLFNSWVGEVPAEARTNGLDIAEVTPVPVDAASHTGIKTIEVTFTLMEGAPVEVVKEEYVMPSEFNAFMMFSDVSGAWTKYEPGTPGDTKVIGDGTYTVYLKAADIGATGQATEGQVFLVDIEELGRAMVELGTLRESDTGALTDTDATVSVEVYVDGKKVNSKNSNILTGDIEGNGRFRIELYNVWGSGTADNPVVMPDLLTPADEIKVIFTLQGTGLNTGAAVPEETPVSTPEATPVAAEVEVVDEGGMSTGLIIGIVVVAVVIIGGVLFFILKKKK